MLAIAEEERVCQHCKNGFIVRGYEIRKIPARKFCSTDCKHRGLSVHTKARAMSLEDAAWFAGLFDGEGWISWPDRNCLTTFRIGIASTSLPLLEKVLAVTGTGKITARPRTDPKHSDVWVWYCYTHNAAALLRQSVGRLIVKLESVEVALGIRRADAVPVTARGAAQRRHRSEK